MTGSLAAAAAHVATAAHAATAPPIAPLAATGVPVVAGRSGGAPESVQHGRTGFVVDGRSTDQIAEAVSRILKDPDLAARMGSAGRRWVIQRWRWQIHVARLATLLAG